MRHYAIVRFATSHESAAAFRASYARRRPMTWAEAVARRHRNTVARTDNFRAVLLCKLGRLSPKWAPQLAVELRVELGEDVCARRVLRHLTQLHADGAVARTSDGYLLAARRSR
jgi:hypothetical protein